MASSVLNRSYIDVSTTALIASIIFHVAFPIFFVSVQLLELWEVRFIPTKKTKRQVYQSYIQVDVVALPDKRSDDTFIEPAKSASKAGKVATPAIPKDILTLPKKKEVKKPKKKINKKKLAKERAAALKQLQKEAQRQQALVALAKEQSRQPIKGNILSKGTASKGRLGTAKDRYADIIYRSIKEHFNIYPWLKRKRLVSIIHVEILPTGKVTKMRTIQSSGNITFEASVKQAIKAAQPLPVPEDLTLLEGGVTIEFRPED